MEASSTSAEYIPSPSTSSSATRIVLFYKYVNIADVAALCAEQRSLATSLGLLGRVLIAAEGVNGTLSGAPAAIDGYIAAMSALALFGGVDWKTSAAGTGVGVGSGVGVGVGVGELEPQLELQPDDLAREPVVWPQTCVLHRRAWACRGRRSLELERSSAA